MQHRAACLVGTRLYRDMRIPLDQSSVEHLPSPARAAASPAIVIAICVCMYVCVRIGLD